METNGRNAAPRLFFFFEHRQTEKSCLPQLVSRWVWGFRLAEIHAFCFPVFGFRSKWKDPKPSPISRPKGGKPFGHLFSGGSNLRINIDESFFTDERIFYASQLIGEHLWMTESRLQRLWLSCFRDRAWLRTAKQINMAMQWPDAVAALLESDLIADEGEGAYRVRGIEKRVQFLIDSSEAGKRSAEARKRKSGTAIPDNARNRRSTEGTFGEPSKVDRRYPEGPPKVVRSATELPSPSPSPSPDQIQNTVQKKASTAVAVADRGAVVGRPVSQNPTHGFLKAYCDAFKLRWGSNPVITGKEAGIAKRVVAAIGQSEAVLLVQAYLQLNDKRIAGECHPLNTFEFKLNLLRVALSKGVERPETADEWNRFWEDVDKGKVESGVRQ